MNMPTIRDVYKAKKTIAPHLPRTPLTYSAGLSNLLDAEIYLKHDEHLPLAQVLRQELSRPKWRRETIAIGTASDPYEPAEAQYCLTRRQTGQPRTQSHHFTRAKLLDNPPDLVSRVNCFFFRHTRRGTSSY